MRTMSPTNRTLPTPILTLHPLLSPLRLSWPCSERPEDWAPSPGSGSRGWSYWACLAPPSGCSPPEGEEEEEEGMEREREREGGGGGEEGGGGLERECVFPSPGSVGCQCG